MRCKKEVRPPPHLCFPPDQFRQTFDEQRARIEGGGAAELHDPLLPGKGGIGDVDLVERFDVVADKGDGDNEDISAPAFREPRNGSFGGGLEPFDRPGLRLEGEFMPPARKPLHHEAHRLFHLGKIWVAFFYERDRERMGGKENGNIFS